MDYTDVVVDGRFILAQRDVTLEWKGSPNQRVIDVKRREHAAKSYCSARNRHKRKGDALWKPLKFSI